MTETVSYEERARVPFATVLASMAGLWLCYFLITTVRAAIVGFEMQDEMLWRRALVTVIGIAMTMLLWLILRLFDNRPLWVQIVAALVIAMPIALPIAQANEWIFADITRQVEENYGKERGMNVRRDQAGNLVVDIPPEILSDLGGLGGGTDAIAASDPTSVMLSPAPTFSDKLTMLIDLALERYFLLLACASLYFALLAGAQAQAAERRGEQFRTAAKAAELRSLRYQVNPHFLFNALNSLSALVMTGKEERAEQMIQTLSQFYRHSLAEDPTGDVLLEDEIELQQHYLAIEAVRFPERLRTHVALPPELGRYHVPGMILQPLVENSVKYGVSASREPVTITIDAREEYGRLVLTVSDDGPGGSPVQGSGFGIGLANVRDRLFARFGNEATITSGPSLEGYETQLRMPLIRHVR